MRARGIRLRTSPITPVGLVLKRLVELAVLEVLRGYDAVASACVDDVVEFDCTSGAIRLAGPGCRDCLPGVANPVILGKLWGRRKLDRLDLDALKCVGAALFSVVEHQLV